MMNTKISLIGAPTDIGAGMRGASMGPEALRVAKLRLEQVQAELDNAKAEVRRLEEVELPAAFTEDGISELSRLFSAIFWRIIIFLPIN